MTALIALLLFAGCPGPDTGSESATDTDTDTTPCASTDADDDGVNACDDCNDDDAQIFPGAVERCNGEDDDCDGAPDPGEELVQGVPMCTACDDAGYWLDTHLLDGAGAIRTALQSDMPTIRCGYSESAAAMFLRIDNHDFEVEGVYTGRHTSVVSQRPDPSTDMNVEHTWPQSEGASAFPMKCDLHHLYPADVTANQRRASYRFGLVTGSVDWAEGGSTLGDDVHGDRVFEPRDVHKGNVARSMLYMSLKYDWFLPADQIALFLQWHAEDPPDDAELTRTFDIAGYQSYANPLVTCPDLPDRLWP